MKIFYFILKVLGLIKEECPLTKSHRGLTLSQKRRLRNFRKRRIRKH